MPFYTVLVDGRHSSTTSSLQSARHSVALGLLRGQEVVVRDEETGEVIDTSDVEPAPGYVPPADPFKVHVLRTSKWA